MISSRALSFVLVAILLATVPAAALEGEYAAAFLMDARTGEVLFAENEHEALPPASMVKMMTELIVLEHVAEGGLTLDDPVKVSAKASKMGGSQVYLKEGEVFPVRDLLMALAIHSANDAAVALAEHVAGSTDAFVELMNLRAEELGMHDTTFRFVHGLPPAYGQRSDLSSAHDMALLGRELTHHPEALAWAVMDRVPFRDGKFILTNPNPLIGKYRGLEGIKTGFHARAGYCLTAAATQKGVRLISVVMGAPTDKARGLETTRLLTRGFNEYTRVTLVAEAGEPLPEAWPVSGGKETEARLDLADALVVSVPKDEVDALAFDYDLPEKLKAPLAAGEVVGRAVARLGDHVLGEVPIIADADVERGNWWHRLLHR